MVPLYRAEKATLAMACLKREGNFAGCFGEVHCRGYANVLLLCERCQRGNRKRGKAGVVAANCRYAARSGGGSDMEIIVLRNTVFLCNLVGLKIAQR
jgi:hypothetical protein